jgi:hypothetical protein
MQLSILDKTFAICRLSINSEIPTWLDQNHFWSITKTSEELSVVCLNEGIPDDVKSERSWKVIKVEGPLDFGLTGILASIANPLAEAKISIFSVSTFDTDYILVKEINFESAKKVLIARGFNFATPL